MDTYRMTKEIFDELYSSLLIPVFLFDQKGVLINANQAFLDLTKTSRVDIKTFSILSFLNVIFKHDIWSLKTLPENHIAKLTLSSGQSIPVLIDYRKLKLQDESYGGGLGFITDLREVNSLKHKVKELTLENETLKDQFAGNKIDVDLKDRRKLEHDLKDAKQFLENVLDSCGDGIVIMDSNMRITRANESFAEMLGKKRDEIEGTYLVEMVPQVGTFKSTTGETVTFGQSNSEQREGLVEKFLMLENGGKIENWEFYVFNKGEDVVPLEATVTIQKDSEGTLTGGICCARDITGRKKIEKKLQDAYEFQGRFFTNITHEFRTPLTLIIGPLERMQIGEFGKIKKEMREQVSISLRNSRQLLKLVNQLLDFSKLESGVKHIITEKKDVNKFIATIVDSFSVVARNKKIKLIFNPAKNISCASVDPGKLEKVLFNLIGNSFKFTPKKGTITVTVEAIKGSEAIEIKSSAKENHIKISITDTGIGIKDEDLATIFDRFRQTDAIPLQKHRGSGVGLAHAKELMEIMDGFIAVQTTYGRGSTFSLYLPVDELYSYAQTGDIPENGEELFLQPEVELSDLMHDETFINQRIEGNKPLLLIVDDNPDVRNYIAGSVKQNYDFLMAGNGKEALQKLEQYKPAVILCDVMMPEMDGYELLKCIKSNHRFGDIPFIFLTARTDAEMKIESLEEGADDYIVKPFNSLELLSRIKSLLRVRSLMKRTKEQEKNISMLTNKLQGKYCYGNIIGNSPSMLKIYQLLETIKESDAPVLIIGETGTGKELIANSIHYNSSRKSGPMISVNCGAIPKELVQSELFGHVKGAYTGAIETRKGYFEEADGGTLFLDEIASMDIDMQVKLLRALEGGEIDRVGDSLPTKVNVRLIAASNKDLLSEVRKGNFREDLYYRLYVIPIHIPPLRERKEDIPLLIDYFMKEITLECKKRMPPLSEKEMSLLINYSCPGNVRELKNIMERFCLLGGNLEHLLNEQPGLSEKFSLYLPFDKILDSNRPLDALASRIKETKAQSEKELIMHVVTSCNNNHSEAARMLNISRSSLYRKINKSS